MKRNACGLSSRAMQLLVESQQWRLVALLFERPRAGWLAELEKLAESCEDPALVAAATSASTASEGEYLALFGPGRHVSPREAGHRKTTDPSKLLSEISAFYGAFSYLPATEETIDHVAVQAGFVGWMKLKEAYARAAGDVAAAELTAAAAQRFVHTHLATMAEPIQRGLADSGADHLIAAANGLVARCGPRPDDVEGGWVPEGLADDSCSFACGKAGGCAPEMDESASESEDPFGSVP